MQTFEYYWRVKKDAALDNHKNKIKNKQKTYYYYWDLACMYMHCVYVELAKRSTIETRQRDAKSWSSNER